ncbi:Golgi membrane protein 1 isoform X1 [Pogona vitticeps]
MVGLGNSRRGMKSPPLLVAALVACIIVLGFNYWIASSRVVDLQNHIMELEGKVRRAELESNEFQRERRGEMEKIQIRHNFLMENANKIHRDEKATLLNNITVNEKLIHSLQEHLKELQQEYGKLQLDIYKFQKNQTNLQRKFTYDMSQCINQMKELKEQCEERIEAISRKGSEIPQIKEKKNISNTSDKNDQVNIQVPTFGQPELQHHDLTKQGNELPEKQESSKLEALKPTSMVKNMAEMDDQKKGTSDVVINKDESKKDDLPVSQDHLQMPAKSSMDNKELPREPGIEQNSYEEVRNGLQEVLVGRTTGKLLEAVDHQNNNEAKVDDEEIEREQLLNDDVQQDDQDTSKGEDPGNKRVNQDSKGVDYNLDVNEAESETDKQAALVDQPNNFNVQNLDDPNLQNHLFKFGEEHQQKL